MDTRQISTIGPADAAHTIFPVATGHYASTPVFGPSGEMFLVDGLLSTGRDNPVLEAFSPSGQLMWKWSPDWNHQIGPPMLAIPAIGPDGTVYETEVPSIGSSVNGVVALDAATGHEKWRTFDLLDLMGPALAPTIGPEGTIYLQTWTHLIVVSPTDGSIKWSWTVPQGSCPTWSPVLSPDGTTVYASGGDGSISALKDGKAVWTRPMAFAGDCPGRPAVATTGQLILTDNGTTSYTAQVAALDANGTPSWTTKAPFPFAGGPALTTAGLVVAETQRGDVLAWDAATGQQEWYYYPDVVKPPSGFGGGSPLVVDAQGTIYAADNYQIAALTPDGTAKWTVPRPSWNTNPAVLSPSGTLYEQGWMFG